MDEVNVVNVLYYNLLLDDAYNVEEFEVQFDVYLVDDQVHVEVHEVLELEHEPNRQYEPLEENCFISLSLQ
jgi:hypothetical protein